MKIVFSRIVLFFIFILVSSCYKVKEVIPGDGLEDWTTETHGASAIPNYDIVFPGNKVLRIDVTIDNKYWEILHKQLADILIYGQEDGEFTDDDPIYVPCTITFNNISWYYVGIRYKGNSSLALTYKNRIQKLPFRFKFNEFENEYPQISGQTFYGFSELSVANNYSDLSLMREKTASDLLKSFGVPVSKTSFCRLYIDYGDGPIYFGLYTLIEVVFDTFLENYFGSNTGNCYKPENDGAKFSYADFTISDFEKKTNEDAANWSDIQNLFDVLHRNDRISDANAWRNNLEAIFDVEIFLKWLAANTTFQNWDTYGQMAHNYYLYHDPSDDKIKWIAWDNNKAFEESQERPTLSFEMFEVSDEWPLINFLLSDTIYRNMYDGYIQDFIDNYFTFSIMSDIYNSQYDLIRPYVTGEYGEQDGYTFLTNSTDFDNAIDELINHVDERRMEALEYLD
jgi:spore coat protein CotH